MTVPVAAAAAVVLIALPRLLPLRQAAPTAAAALWLSSLALRALLSCYLVVYVLLFLPRTDAFHAVTGWCWHTVLPGLQAGLRIEGHQVGDTLASVPSMLLTVVSVSVLAALYTGARSVRRLIAQSAIGRGPGASVMVGGTEVVLAAAGLLRPRVIVSVGALTVLEDDELAAGMDHERGHIARCHRVWLALAEVLRALGRPLPGGQRAHAELVFQLERDADRFALKQRHDPVALASVILKATRPQLRTAGLSSLDGSGAGERLRELLEPAKPADARSRRAVNALATLVVVGTLAAAAALPAVAAIGGQQSPGAGHHSHHGAI